MIANATQRKFYPIINSLRALAVTSVVGYHAGIPFLPGGYVGVDVFFVISGFLIISHIIEEQRARTFTFAGFYARRAIRILPPYFVVIAACMLIAPFALVLPKEFEAFRDEVAWSAAMAANYLFLSQQGYFDASASTKILLHLWSLAVEEQFYLVAPLTIAGLWALAKGLARPAVGIFWSVAAVAIFLVSFALCIYFTDSERNHAFYQMPYRAWEFIAGGVLGLALPHARKFPAIALDAMLVIGLAMIGAAIGLFSHDTPFPSFWAAVPVLGTCIVIVGGIARPEGFARFLSPRPVLWIGLVSYSWYLWHWPALFFGRIFSFQDPALARDLAMSGIALALAFVTYFMVERPFAHLRSIKPESAKSWWPTSVGIHVSCFTVIACAMLMADLDADARNRIPKGFLQQTKMRFSSDCALDRGPLNEKCGDQTEFSSTGVLIGDSHAMSIYNELRRTFNSQGVQLTSIAHHSCLPLLGVKSHRRDQEKVKRCEERIDGGLAELAALPRKAEFAIIYSRWNVYSYIDPERVARGHQTGISLPNEQEPSKDQRPVFVSGLRAMLSKLRDVGIRRVLIIAPTPELHLSAPECLARAHQYNLPLDAKCGITRQEADERRAASLAWLAESVENLGARLVDPIDAFCNSTNCFPQRKMKALYFDDDHLSAEGAKMIINAIQPSIRWVLIGDAQKTATY